MQNKTPNLTPRLLSVASYVRSGSFVSDVGTDHAYLPIYLVLSGKASGAVASDINEGPYMRALLNIREHNLEKKITAVLTPGLLGIEKYSPDDILICGMGGELIASIIEDAPFTKNSSIRLVLQPMTHSEILRKYLLDNGFIIVSEALAKEEKIYEIICAEYSAEKCEAYTEIELLLGKRNIEHGGELFSEFIDRHLLVLIKIYTSNSSAGADTSNEERLIKKLEELKK